MLLNSRLYLILDKASCGGRNLIHILSQAVSAGIGIIQLRENASTDRNFLKDALIIRRLTRTLGLIYIINNRADIALLCAADGLHLGQSDLPPASARKIIGENKIIGVSCRNLSQAMQAQSQGADYIGIGPVFNTSTKPNLKPIDFSKLGIITRKINIPVFAIGGINKTSIKPLIASGVERFALCRAICRAKSVRKAVKELQNIINDDPD